MRAVELVDAKLTFTTMKSEYVTIPFEVLRSLQVACANMVLDRGRDRFCDWPATIVDTSFICGGKIALAKFFLTQAHSANCVTAPSHNRRGDCAQARPFYRPYYLVEARVESQTSYS